MDDHKHFRESVLLTIAFVGILWAIKSWEYAAAADLSYLGIYPRTLKGSIGILTAPFIHGDIQHLISNSFPLVVLGTGLLFFYRSIALEVFSVIYFATGLWVWAIARPAFHIGASGLVYGLAAFLFFIGLLRKDARSLAISLVVVFLYHGLFAGIFPLSTKVSWESHLLGGCAGIMCAFYYRHRIRSAEENGVQPETTETGSPLSEAQQSVVQNEIKKEWRVVFMPDDDNDTSKSKCEPVKIPESLFIKFRNTSGDEDSSDKETTRPPENKDDDDLISLN